MSKVQDEQNVIRVDAVEKGFSGRQVLSNVSFAIKSGEIFGLLGPSGAGKTTLIKILTGQLRPDRGVASILGRDSSKLDGKTYMRIGMVLDDSGMYARLSCYDNLALFADIYGISRKRISESLAQVGLLEAKKRPVQKLSKGMRQRLVFARALLHQPKVLFLDEPTSGLDPITLNEIHRLILAEKERGTCILLTTHNMEEAAKLCERVALLFEGKIVEQGSPGEICRRYNHQNRIRLLLKNGAQEVLENGASAAEGISRYLRENAIESIHSTEPTLETVFMELTGRSLGEYEKNSGNSMETV